MGSPSSRDTSSTSNSSTALPGTPRAAGMGSREEEGLGPRFTARPAHTPPTGLSCRLGLLESGAGHVYRTTRQNHPEGSPHPSHQPARPQAGRGRGEESSGQSRPLTSALSVCQVRGDHDLPPLSHAHALQARVQAFDHFVGPQSCLLRGPVVVASGESRFPGQHSPWSPAGPAPESSLEPPHRTGCQGPVSRGRSSPLLGWALSCSVAPAPAALHKAGPAAPPTTYFTLPLPLEVRISASVGT